MAMILKGLQLKRSSLAGIAEARPRTPTSSNGDGRRSNPRAGVLSAEVLAATLESYSKCRCEELVGLRAGMTYGELVMLGSGCTASEFHHGRPGWVCGRLDKIRRTW